MSALFFSQQSNPSHLLVDLKGIELVACAASSSFNVHVVSSDARLCMAVLQPMPSSFGLDRLV